MTMSGGQERSRPIHRVEWLTLMWTIVQPTLTAAKLGEPPPRLRGRGSVGGSAHHLVPVTLLDGLKTARLVD